jgi:hypothetical protein
MKRAEQFVGRRPLVIGPNLLGLIDEQSRLFGIVSSLLFWRRFEFRQLLLLDVDQPM